jgi:two-component system, OmpR family, response regulator RegX3
VRYPAARRYLRRLAPRVTPGSSWPSMVVESMITVSNNEVVAPAGRALLAMHRQPARTGALAEAFAQVGLVPTLAFEPAQLLTVADREPFDVVLVDLELLGEAAVPVIRRVSQSSHPAVIVAARDFCPPELFSAGIHAQVDDQASPADVAGRAVALLGLRARGATLGMLRWGPLELDGRRREARWYGQPLSLTPLQFRILTGLVLADGAVMSRDEIHRFVWGTSPVDGGERIVAHIRRIRAKIEPDPAHPRFLVTTRGEGFRLALSEEDDLVPRNEHEIALPKGRDRAGTRALRRVPAADPPRRLTGS